MIAAKSMATLQSGDRGLVETMLVHNMERALARTAPPFCLRVTAIPVDGTAARATEL